jgi:integrase/recombinase XerC
MVATYPKNGWWFPSYACSGEHIRGQSVTQMISNVFRRAGVKPGAHRLRHWYATKLLEAGADLRTVQELMRHASVQSTQIYTQVTDQRRREAIDRLGLPAALHVAA